MTDPHIDQIGREITEAFRLGLWKHNTKHDNKFTGYVQLSLDPEDAQVVEEWLKNSPLMAMLIEHTGARWVHWRPQCSNVIICCFSMYVKRVEDCFCSQGDQPAGSKHSDDTHSGRTVYSFPTTFGKFP